MVPRSVGQDLHEIIEEIQKGITMENLEKIWRAVVEDLKGCGIDIHEPDEALKGALRIR